MSLLLNVIFVLTLCSSPFCSWSQEETPPPASLGESIKREKLQGVYDIVDEPAEFPGGMLALRKFVADNLKYPERPLKDSIEGKCVVKLLITDKGEVQQATITKSVENYPEFDKEALRVMYLMPKWKPAKVNGKDVSSYYRIPVSFKRNTSIK